MTYYDTMCNLIEYL